MKIIYGTTNSGKILSMQRCLDGLKPDYDIEIVGPPQSDSVPDIKEDGRDPLENARKKAEAYYNVYKSPVFSADSGLYFDGLPERLQPGLNVRRVNGKRLNDEEMIEYYSRLARDNGGRLIARYVNGVCLIINDDLRVEHMGDSISTTKFIISSVPHSRRTEGFPLDSLSMHIASNKYFFDLLDEQYDKEGLFSIDDGLRSFFKKALDTLNGLKMTVE